MSKTIGPYRLNPRGDYNPAADPLYSLLDLVSDGGGSYVYINDTPSNEPTSSTSHWQQIASMGGQDLVDAAVAARDAAQGHKDAAAASALQLAAGVASPAGVYADYDALVAADPDNSKIYLVLGTGGTQEVDTLTITGAPSANGNLSITLNGVTKTVAVLTTDDTSGVATKIKALSWTGWTDAGTGAAVSFTKNTVGTNTPAVFSAGDTGVTATFVLTTPGVAATTSDWYFWDGTDWIDGGVYQAVAIDNASIPMVKLRDEAVTPNKTTFIASSVNLFNKDDVLLGYIWGTPSLMLSANASFSCIEMDVEPDTTYTISGTNYFGYFLNEAGAAIENFGHSSTSMPALVITSPPNAVKMRISYRHAIFPTAAYMVVKGTELPAVYVPYGHTLDEYTKLNAAQVLQVVNEMPDITPDMVSFLANSSNLFDKRDAEDSMVWTYGSGAFSQSSNALFACIKMAVSPGTIYTVSQTDYLCYFSDVDDAYISTFANSSTPYTDLEVTAPARAKYMRLNWRKATVPVDRYMVVEGETMPGVYSAFGYTFSIPINSVGEASGIYYVSPDGDDDDAGAVSSPFLTFQKAIDEGATRIYAQAGDYGAQTIVASDMPSLEIKVLPPTYSMATVEKQRAVFDNSIDVELAYDETTELYIAAFTAAETSNWHKVFITEALPIERPDLRSTSYNAILWEITADIPNHLKLVPVLTVAACQATAGTFTYDGTNIYVNPTGGTIADKTYKRMSVEEGITISLTNINRLAIEDVEVQYPPTIGICIVGCNETAVRHCITGHSAYSTGQLINNSNANFQRCESYKNCADGFAPTLYGDVNYIGCKAHYNYDDGISHHQNTTGQIIGGEYHHNTKGGVAPAHGAEVDLMNIVSHDNGYGIYAQADDGYNVGKTVRHTGCVCYDNTTGIKVRNYHVLSYNCKYTDNATPTSVTVNDDTSLTIL